MESVFKLFDKFMDKNYPSVNKEKMRQYINNSLVSEKVLALFETFAGTDKVNQLEEDIMKILSNTKDNSSENKINNSFNEEITTNKTEFIEFFQKYRGTIKAENPKMSQQEINIELKKMWINRNNRCCLKERFENAFEKTSNILLSKIGTKIYLKSNSNFTHVKLSDESYLVIINDVLGSKELNLLRMESFNNIEEMELSPVYMGNQNSRKNGIIHMKKSSEKYYVYGGKKIKTLQYEYSHIKKLFSTLSKYTNSNIDFILKNYYPTDGSVSGHQDNEDTLDKNQPIFNYTIYKEEKQMRDFQLIVPWKSATEQLKQQFHNIYPEKQPKNINIYIESYDNQLIVMKGSKFQHESGIKHAVPKTKQTTERICLSSRAFI